jgi:hypothetical protein
MIDLYLRSDLNAQYGMGANIGSSEALNSFARSIMIAIPWTTSIHPELIDLMLAWRMAGIDVVPFQNAGGFLEITRAHITKEFMKTYKKYLVMIDSDCVPSPEGPMALACQNLPVVAGIAPIFHPVAGICANFQIEHDGKIMWPSVAAGVKLPMAGLAPVAWAGCGMICIQRNVIEKINKKETPFFIPEADRKKAAETGLIEPTEDRVFSEQVKRAGFEVFIDFEQHLKHYKHEGYCWPKSALENPAELTEANK